MIFHYFWEGKPTVKKLQIFLKNPIFWLEKINNMRLIHYLSSIYRLEKNRAKNVEK